MATAVAFQFTGSGLQSPYLRHAMSGRLPDAAAEGDVGHGPNTVAEIIERNRNAFLHSAGFVPDALVVGRQTHATNVAVVTAADRGRGRYPLFDGFPATDAMITQEVDLPLGTIVADCVPILLFDPQSPALGVVHAGWRGTVGGIVVKAIEAMRAEFGSDAAQLQVGIGPSIGPCCYSVGAEVIDAWHAAQASNAGAGAAVHATDDDVRFDLWTANALQVAAAGVPEGQIEQSGVCVRCALDQFFSYRGARQTPAAPGRNMLVAQLCAAT